VAVPKQTYATGVFSDCGLFSLDGTQGARRELSTVAMFPIIVTMYVKLARREEKEVLAEFGDTYRRYILRTPAFIPRISRHPGVREV
jgi:protein-S-isoprenylcysteine O-methyltransferase Ste14